MAGILEILPARQQMDLVWPSERFFDDLEICPMISPLLKCDICIANRIYASYPVFCRQRGVSRC
jgi:hypothetical protein